MRILPFIICVILLVIQVIINIPFIAIYWLLGSLEPFDVFQGFVDKILEE